MKNKILKLLSLTGILSIMFASNIFANIPRVLVQWKSKDFWGKYTVNNTNEVKSKIVYDTGYSKYYAFNYLGEWQNKKGFFEGSNGCAIINNDGVACQKGWGTI